MDANDAAVLQRKFEQILDWCPETSRFLTGKEDVSGLGHGQVVSHFNDEHVKATSKVVDLLVKKFDETHELNAVLDYADNLQRNGEVNHYVLQWAVEIFIVHSDEAKKSGMRYPEPKDLEPTLRAISVVSERKGKPKESWMNYWRSDADVNFHHRHWHTVYIAQSIIHKSAHNWCGVWRKDKPELIREGELFAYMHHQMLARYNAERRSWGLEFTEAWHYTDRDPLGYDAGYEFDHSKKNEGFISRPPGSWQKQDQEKFKKWTDSYKKACDKGELPAVELTEGKGNQVVKMDYNMSGHVLEAASNYWFDEFGSIHNYGHEVFGTNLLNPEKLNEGMISYMASTVTAVRDPIFFRWHQHIDDLWQYWNNKQTIELADDPPPVLLRPSDIVMKKTSDPLEGFANFSSDDFTSDEMSTYLEAPKKRFERDFKLFHDEFFYHIRFQRSNEKLEDELNLTFRVFICPQDQMNDRRMWIEMDKFVYKLPSEQKSAVVIRPDLHSSVIKRIPSLMKNNIEKKFIKESKGYCECGWPYNVLLPRGTQEGETWSLCVYVTDNDKDRIGIYSSCGSMSYCGANKQAYPDKRPMGYPFTTAVSIHGEKLPITEAFPKLNNTTFSSFVIRNNVGALPLPPHITLWSPWKQLDQNDGLNNPDSSDKDDTIFIASAKTGRMRVLIDTKFMNQEVTSNKVYINFEGRGAGNGSYSISEATISKRNGNSLDISPGSNTPITVGGESSFDVPDDGTMSDEIIINNIAEDLFVTFTLNNPGSNLVATDDRALTSTWLIPNPTGENARNDDWGDIDGIQNSPNVFCVGDIMMLAPKQQ